VKRSCGAPTATAPGGRARLAPRPTTAADRLRLTRTAERAACRHAEARRQVPPAGRGPTGEQGARACGRGWQHRRVALKRRTARQTRSVRDTCSSTRTSAVTARSTNSRRRCRARRRPRGLPPRPLRAVRRVVSAAVPGLRRWDADLQAPGTPRRRQCAAGSMSGRPYDALHLTPRTSPCARCQWAVVPSVSHRPTNRLNAERIGAFAVEVHPRCCAGHACRAPGARGGVGRQQQPAARSLRDDTAAGLTGARAALRHLDPPPLPRDCASGRGWCSSAPLERKCGSSCCG
jgi:hypothetical protein